MPTSKYKREGEIETACATEPLASETVKIEIGTPWAIQAHRDAASIVHIVDADGDNLFTSVFRPFAEAVVALVNRSAAPLSREAALVEALKASEELDLCIGYFFGGLRSYENGVYKERMTETWLRVSRALDVVRAKCPGVLKYSNTPSYDAAITKSSTTA